MHGINGQDNMCYENNNCLKLVPSTRALDGYEAWIGKVLPQSQCCLNKRRQSEHIPAQLEYAQSDRLESVYLLATHV